MDTLAFAPLLPSSLAVPCVCPPDSLGWKLFYVTGCLFVAVQNLEDWEVRVVPASAQVTAVGSGPGLMPHPERLAKGFLVSRAWPLEVGCP